MHQTLLLNGEKHHPIRSRLARWFLDPVLDFLYPPLCLSCGAALQSALEENENPNLLNQQKSFSDLLCSLCCTQLIELSKGHAIFREVHHRLEQWNIELVLSAFLMEHGGVLQLLIHEMKYNGLKRIGRRFGEIIGHRLQEQDSKPSIDGIVPVPLHFTKQRERGFNQSDIIAHGISLVTGFPVRSDLLRRTRYTDSQTKLGLEERRANVAGAFAVVPSRQFQIKAKRFLIVDDVITTGATLSECARALFDSGAAWIGAASVALVSFEEASRQPVTSV
ncbi:MAG: ComF family protein [Bacteroidota bacterium]